jgi:dihydroorotate dehydrogenase (fumarate)
MSNIKTSYMGIELSSPVIVGASPISRKLERIKKAEEAGAGALVIHSLFQEQIETEVEELESALMIGSNLFPEALTYFPILEHSGAREHIMWVEKARKQVNMPLIGSLNATSLGRWLDYAKQLQDAGCNALELNLYAIETDMAKTASDIEKHSIDVISSVVGEVTLPVSVKLTPWHTTTANFVSEISKTGVRGIVMFNRFYQPGIDTQTQTLKSSFELSRPEDNRLPLRWAAILFGKIDLDLVTSTGVHSGDDVVKQILAGAKAAQTVSALLKYGESYITKMNDDITSWMDHNGYEAIEDFRGKLSQQRVDDPTVFERVQYANIMMGNKS